MIHLILICIFFSVHIHVYVDFKRYFDVCKYASTNTKDLKRVSKRTVRLARKTLTLSCLIPAVLARDRLVFVKDRPVSSLGVFVFEFLGSSFSSFRVLRFRGLGASFSRFGCLVLRSSFSSASFSKLPLVNMHLIKGT